MDSSTARGRSETANAANQSRRSESPASSASSNSSTSLSDNIPSWLLPFVNYLSDQFAWVKPSLTFSNLKPALRCAIVAWVSLILFIIPKVQAVMGQASFLILIAIALSPPADPFLSVLEREILILLFSCIAWAWCCLGLFLANLARRVHDPTVTLFDVVDGRYIEAAPSIIIGIFIFFGSATIVGFKAKQGPGPYFVPCIIACIVINISMTTGALFPFPSYLTGQTILIPVSFHSALCILGSIFIFPSTISASFTTCLQDTLSPGLATISSHISILSTPLTSPSFPAELATLRANTKKCETTLMPLTAARRLLHNDVIYGRFAPEDFIPFHEMLRRFAGRADGLSVFFGLVDPARERFPGVLAVNTPAGTPKTGLSRTSSPAPSLERLRTGETAREGSSSTSPILPTKRSALNHPGLAPVASEPLILTAIGARFTSRPPTPTHKTPHAHSVLHSHLNLDLETSSSTPAIASSLALSKSISRFSAESDAPHSPTHSRAQSVEHLSHSHHQHQHHHRHHHHDLLHSSLLSLARAHSKRPEYAVGTFESQRYLNLEATALWDPMEETWNLKVGGLLKESCIPLLESCSLGITNVKEWFSTVRDTRLAELFSSAPSPSGAPASIELDEKGVSHPNRSHHLPADASPDAKENDNANASSSNIFNKLSFLWVSPRRIVQESRRKRALRLNKLKEVRQEVSRALDEFRTVGRHSVLEPYKHAFDPDHDGPNRRFSGESRIRDYIPLDVDDEARTGADVPETPAHRYLFNCFVFQYNLLQISAIILEMLDEIIRLEELRTRCRLWTPAERVFSWSPWLLADYIEHFGEDEDPDVIQGLNPDSRTGLLKRKPTVSAGNHQANAGVASPNGTDNFNDSTQHPIAPILRIPSQRTGPAFDIPSSNPAPSTALQYPPDHTNALKDLGLPQRRDPDALPPRNVVEWLMALFYQFFMGLWSDSVLFAIKAGLLTVALSLPSLIKASAGFAYDNRFFWGIFMGQLTIARFRGDTFFMISVRIISTFFGAIVGMIIWYISCGSGNGNPYGLAAACAVCFPVMFFARIYWPIPPMRNLVFFVTIILVIGYSYQDTLLNLPGTPGVGWPVAWKRFTLVTAGVVAAFIASFFPPSTTIRLYQRRLLATTSSELGSIYCSILSFANTKHEPEIQEIISSLIAVRNKLNKSAVMLGNVGYEFSFRGRWPADRYRKIAELQLGISYALSHLMSVLEHIEPSWARAFLRRTRFMDPGFQGDVLAVISMISSSLRTGNPLPQITPCPLIDRFMLKYHGLNVIHKDAEEDYGLPRILSMDTLMDEQYMMFSVGISTAFGIINRLDRLMLAVKEVVGEQYHIHGVGFAGAQMLGDPYFSSNKPPVDTPATYIEPSGLRPNAVHFESPV